MGGGGAPYQIWASNRRAHEIKKIEELLEADELHLNTDGKEGEIHHGIHVCDYRCIQTMWTACQKQVKDSGGSYRARVEQAITEEALLAHPLHVVIAPLSASYHHFLKKADIGVTTTGVSAGFEREEKEEQHTHRLDLYLYPGNLLHLYKTNLRMIYGFGSCALFDSEPKNYFVHLTMEQYRMGLAVTATIDKHPTEEAKTAAAGGVSGKEMKESENRSEKGTPSAFPDSIHGVATDANGAKVALASRTNSPTRYFILVLLYDCTTVQRCEEVTAVADGAALVERMRQWTEVAPTAALESCLSAAFDRRREVVTEVRKILRDYRAPFFSDTASASTALGRGTARGELPVTVSSIDETAETIMSNASYTELRSAPYGDYDRFSLLRAADNSLIRLLPSHLLGHIACYLQPDSLLHLQRCSSQLRRLRHNTAFAAVAWQWAELSLSPHWSLHTWAVPYKQCVIGSAQVVYVPVTVWQAALPVLRAVVSITEGESPDQQCKRLGELVRQEQPTRWILAKRDEHGWWRVGDDNVEQSGVVERVEVLNAFNWRKFFYKEDNMVNVHCRLVLRACPYLQHLHLTLNADHKVKLSNQDTFALVPCLRSLQLNQAGHVPDGPHWKVGHSLLDFQAMLHSFPQLTSLRCTNIRWIGVPALLEIALHSTLEEVYIDNSEGCMADAEWIGRAMNFPISVEEDERQLEEDAARLTFDGDIEEEKDESAAVLHPDKQSNDGESEGREPEGIEVEMQRMRAALTRTQPTERSCQVRLALADWLHRRLRRGKLPIDRHPDQSKSLLRRYREQVALLRFALSTEISSSSTPQPLLQDGSRLLPAKVSDSVPTETPRQSLIDEPGAMYETPPRSVATAARSLLTNALGSGGRTSKDPYQLWTPGPHYSNIKLLLAEDELHINTAGKEGRAHRGIHVCDYQCIQTAWLARKKKVEESGGSYSARVEQAITAQDLLANPPQVIITPRSPHHPHFPEKVDVGASMTGGNAALEEEQQELEDFLCHLLPGSLLELYDWKCQIAYRFGSGDLFNSGMGDHFVHITMAENRSQSNTEQLTPALHIA